MISGDTLVAAAAGLAGALIGGFVSIWSQHLATRRQEQHWWDETRRTACSAFLSQVSRARKRFESLATESDSNVRVRKAQDVFRDVVASYNEVEVLAGSTSVQTNAWHLLVALDAILERCLKNGKRKDDQEWHLANERYEKHRPQFVSAVRSELRLRSPQ